MYRKTFGKWGEAYAASWLEKQGYTPVSTNFHTHHGEIDLVMKQGETLVFVEVKTRSSRAYGYGEDSITHRKINSLLTAINAYFDLHPEGQDDWRLDVIAIERLPGGHAPEIVHYENVGDSDD